MRGRLHDVAENAAADVAGWVGDNLLTDGLDWTLLPAAEC